MHRSRKLVSISEERQPLNPTHIPSTFHGLVDCFAEIIRQDIPVSNKSHPFIMKARQIMGGLYPAQRENILSTGFDVCLDLLKHIAQERPELFTPDTLTWFMERKDKKGSGERLLRSLSRHPFHCSPLSLWTESFKRSSAARDKPGLANFFVVVAKRDILAQEAPPPPPEDKALHKLVIERIIHLEGNRGSLLLSWYKKSIEEQDSQRGLPPLGAAATVTTATTAAQGVFSSTGSCLKKTTSGSGSFPPIGRSIGGSDPRMSYEQPAKHTRGCP